MKSKYEIGDTVIDDKRNMTITNKITKNRKKITNGKEYIFKESYYKYHCNKCGYDGDIRIGHFDREGKGCVVCAGRKVIYGVNDVYSKNPDLLEYIVDKEEAKTYGFGSNKYVDCICPHCNYIKKIKVCNLYSKGFKCNRCNDNLSYPNKFLTSFLKQLYDSNTIKDYVLEKSFDWSNNRRYDSFITLNNGQTLIIEAHGGQHFGFKNIHVNTFKNGTKTLQHEQRNDADKCWMAYKNGINHYIQLDCRMSDMVYIKNSIENSIILRTLLDLSKVNWEECNSFSISSMLLTICEYWENNKKDNPNLTTKDLGEHFKLNRFSIINYLKKGSELGFCSYNPKEEMIKSNNRTDKNIKTRRKIGIYKDGILLGEYECISHLIEDYMNSFNIKFFASIIQKVAKGERNHHKGYTFKYL